MLNVNLVESHFFIERYWWLCSHLYLSMKKSDFVRVSDLVAILQEFKTCCSCLVRHPPHSHTDFCPFCYVKIHEACMPLYWKHADAAVAYPE